MTKADLINQICKEHKDVSKRMAGELVDTCFVQLGKGIKKDKRFTYPGFGTWTLKNRKARKGVNPQTGQKITIKASKTVTFKPSVEFKKGLNKNR